MHNTIRNRIWFVAFVLLVAYSTPFHSLTAQDELAEKTKAANKNIASALESEANFDYDETPWGDIQEDVTFKYGIEFHLDDSAIKDGFTQDEPITIKVSGVRLRNAFTLILRSKNATYFVRDGMIVICSLDEVERIGTKESEKAKARRLRIDNFDNYKIAKRIAKKVSVDFDEVPWADVQKLLESKLYHNFSLDQSAMDDALTSEEPITAKGDLSLKEILAAKNATYIIQHGVVMIVSVDSKLANEYKAPTPPPVEIIKVAEGNISFEVSKIWEIVTPANRMLEAEIKVDREEGDEQDGRMTIMGAGGSIDANIKRWEDQFVGAKAHTWKNEVGGLVTFVTIEGTFMDAPGGPFSGKPKIERKNYQMLAAIIQTKDHGNYFVKFYGPKLTVKNNSGYFFEMIKSLKVEK